MQNTFKKLNSCIDNKTQRNLVRFLGQYKMCFREPEWKFINNKYHEVSNFCELPKIHEPKITELTALNFLNQMT